MDTTLILHIALGLLVIAIGLSFAYKCFCAAVLGTVKYWEGFLPITLVSPLFTHLPAGKRSLIKEAKGLWVHVIMGPLFLVLSLMAIAAGTQLIGLPGVDTLNYVMSCGNTSMPRAITYDGRYSFRSPLLIYSAKKFRRMLGRGQFKIADKDRVNDSEQLRAEEAVQRQDAERDY